MNSHAGLAYAVVFGLTSLCATGARAEPPAAKPPAAKPPAAEPPAAEPPAAEPPAAEPPAAEEVKRVVEYFNNGKGQGPVLLEMTPCLEIGKPEGERKKKCVKPITAAIRAGTTAYVYLRWVVPRDDKYDDITVDWVRGEEVEASTAISVSTSWSYGIWKAKGLSKPGTWTVRVRRGELVLAESQILVE